MRMRPGSSLSTLTRSLFGLRPFLQRLADAFGWPYVLTVIFAYGVNQGVGEKFVFGARDYFLMDNIGLSSAEFGRVAGFSHIPWQLKSLFGLLSDVVPLGGYHRAPYMQIGGVLGVVALLALTFLPLGVLTAFLVGSLFLLVNVNFSMPDVMIDATVAERSKVRPELGAELQALCWGSLGAFGLPAGIAKGFILTYFGPRPLFCLSTFAALAVVIPPRLGWLGDSNLSGESMAINFDVSAFFSWCSVNASHPCYS